MNEENKRKAIILTFIGALTLLFVVVGGTFAYFQLVDTNNGSTSTDFEGATEALNKYGTPILEDGSDLFINLSASDMSYGNKGKSFWAVSNEEQELNHKDNRSNYVISTAKIQDPNSEGSVNDAYLKCTSELTITVEGTKASSLKAGDGKLYLGVTSDTEENKGSISPDSYDLFDLVQEQGEEGKKVTVNYTIVGFTSANVIADVEIVNRDDDQNYLAGDNTNEESELTITITNTNLSCSVSEKPMYAKLDNNQIILDGKEYGEMYKSQDYYDRIEKISFVDYVPSEEELSSLTHWDLSDTASGTLENSVIAWLVKNGNNGYKYEHAYDELKDDEIDKFTDTEVELYDMFIGSKSKIYVKDLSYAFEHLANLKEIIFDNLNTSETNDMSFMFGSCVSLSTLDLSTFDTSQVTDMSEMFSGGYTTMNLKEIKGLENFDTSSVTNMSYMFANCRQLETLDLSTFDTSKVKNMSDMFYYCSNLTTLDLSTFNTSSVTNMSYMFCGNQKLNSLDISNFTFDNIITVGGYSSGIVGTFYNVPSSCQVKINKNQQGIFEDKFPLNGTSTQGKRTFTPEYVD